MTDTSIRLPNPRELIQVKYEAPDEACRLNDHVHHLAGLNKFEAAVVALRRAVAIAPTHPILLSCLGAVLFDVGRYAEAETVLRQSLQIEPEYAPAHGNLGAVLGGMNRPHEAWESFKRAIALDATYVDARWNYSMSLLDHGNWSEGFKWYEDRKGRMPGANPVLPYPTWRGEDLNGKTLYVQGEQGVGDRILFSRYLSWVKDEFPECRILFMPNAADLPDIGNFLWGLRGVVEFLPNGIPWPEADYGIYLMSLPALHGTTPDHVYADPGLIRKQAERHRNSVLIPSPNSNRLKVGICWTGNTAMKRNTERSIPFEAMLTLANNPDVVLYSLQFNSREIESVGADQLVCDLTHDIGSLGFCGTAACMLNLDLIITCCTSVAHVAGALGVPCWTLLCSNSYWVWLRGRQDSVWYPNMRLFRQKTMNDWAPVIDDVRNELAAFKPQQLSVAA